MTKKLTALLIVLIYFIFTTIEVNAKTIQINFSELQNTPESTAFNTSIGSALGLTYAINEHNRSLQEGCAYSSVLDWLQGDLLPTNTSNITLNFSTLGKPIEMLLTLPLQLQANGHVEQKFGLKAFGECLEYAEDGFDLSVNGVGQITLKVIINPIFEVIADTLTLTAELSVDTEMQPFVFDVNVEGTLLESELEDRLRDEIYDAMNAQDLEESLSKIEESIKKEFSFAKDQLLELELAGVSTENIQSFIELLENDVNLPLTRELLTTYLQRFFKIDSSAENPQSSFTSAITCELLNASIIEQNTAPLYRQTEAACRQISASLITEEGTYFTDSQCSNPINFRPTNLQSFCQNTIDTNRVGDGALLANIKPAWTLSPGVKMDVGLASTEGKPQPFSTSRVYKKIQTDNGLCELEMRVYKENIADKELVPLIALHGGSWQYRSNGILGIEALAAHYTHQGFAVFAPFYRVVRDKSGPAACQNVTAKEIVSDVSDALDWVKTHKNEFGLSDEKIRLTGQSAGAHLATWLSVNRAEEIERTLLLYPPTDVGDYLQEWLQGNLGENPKGLSIISHFLNMDVHTIDLSNSLIQANSFPQTLAQSPKDYPPIFIIHGGDDQLVPLRQSQRLCNAFKGNPESGPASIIESDHSLQKRQIFSCDNRDSQLHVITEADHTLDVCLFSILCPAGDQESQNLARDSLQKGYQWLRQNNPKVKSDSNEKMTENSGEMNNKKTGGGSLNIWWLLSLSYLSLGLKSMTTRYKKC
ncbi:MAG TPA: hypothetical protein DD827_04250 [Gammaproteobacteria bacterium]|nr:hypothetical protein [Gammaproteobacteria bacterium]